MTPWIKQKDADVLLRLWIQPRASKNGVVGVHGDRLKIRITAPPVDGAANEAIAKFLAKLCGVASSNIVFLRGETGKNKDILILNSRVGDIKDKLYLEDKA